MAHRPDLRLAVLTVLGPTPVRHVLHVDRDITIGRSTDCTIVIDADGVQPVHAHLWCYGEAWILTEAPSNDDVRVNGQPVEDALLTAGDHIAIGPLELRFEGWLPRPAAAPPAAAPERIIPASPEPEVSVTATGLGRIGVGAHRIGSDIGSAAGDVDDLEAVPPPEPVILLAFADAHGEVDGGYLRNLVREQHTVTECLRDVERTYGFRVVCEGNVTLPRLFDLLDRFDDRLVALHYGGHATPDGLMVEDERGRLVPVWSRGLLRRLSRLPQLAFVFLNGCHTHDLLDGDRWAGRAWVIGTLQAIRDRVACDFARRFYTALVWGCHVEDAFERARDASEARFRDPDETWRMMRPVTETDRPWPWQLVRPAGASRAGADPWGLSSLDRERARAPSGRIVVDSVSQRRGPPARLYLDVIVRNVGQRLATLSRVLVVPLHPAAGPPEPVPTATGGSVPEPVAGVGGGSGHPASGARPAMAGPPRPATRPPPLPVGASMETRAPMPGGGAWTTGIATDSVYDMNGPDGHVTPEGTWSVPIARYVPANDFDRFSIRLDRDMRWSELGLTIIYDRQHRAVSPLVELRR